MYKNYCNNYKTIGKALSCTVCFKTEYTKKKFLKLSELFKSYIYLLCDIFFISVVACIAVNNVYFSRIFF